jgi:hypothetical protein
MQQLSDVAGLALGHDALFQSRNRAMLHDLVEDKNAPLVSAEHFSQANETKPNLLCQGVSKDYAI